VYLHRLTIQNNRTPPSQTLPRTYSLPIHLLILSTLLAWNLRAERIARSRTESKVFNRCLRKERSRLCSGIFINILTLSQRSGTTYFPTCLLRYALSLAVQGLMMVSEGEMYVCFPLLYQRYQQLFFQFQEQRNKNGRLD
jgi:hypothetical protein